MYKITKEFNFCYGHRVWSQSLNPTFSLDSCLKCRHLHGHQGTINISLEAEVLIDGMVTDFKHLNWFKKWLDDTLDHKFIMDRNDPLLSHEIYPLLTTRDLLLSQDNTHWVLNEETYKDFKPCIIEKFEGMIFVDFIPTSENLCKWIFDIVTEKMKPLGIKVSGVQFYETPKSQSNFTI